MDKNLVREEIVKAVELVGTQHELADICGVSQPLVSGWCRGDRKPGPRPVATLYQALGVDLRWLYPDIFQTADRRHPQPYTGPERRQQNEIKKEVCA